MTKSEILAEYNKLSPADRRSFNRWLSANALVGCMFSLALVAFAAAGLRPEETATARVPAPMQSISFLELHGLAHLDNLPVIHIDNQALVFAGSEAEARSAMLAQGDGDQR
jgi:hypothetical protein